MSAPFMNAEAQQRSALGCELVAEVARSSGEVSLQLTGGSMLPTIWPGDLVTVRRHEAVDLEPGNIVCYARGQTLVAHRLIAKVGDQLVTQGDCLASWDPPVRTSDVLGRVVSIERNGRRLSPAQSSWQRMAAAILRRSDFTTRMTLRLGRLLRRLRPTETAWAS